MGLNAGESSLFEWNKIIPKKPSGKLYKWRTYFSWALLIILFGAPFLKVNGHPFILLDFLERKFIVFGKIFWPQDFYIFLLAVLILIVFIIIFTILFGRLWCGWACPQTIFMEMVFRKIEYFIEGDANNQRALKKQEWDAVKLLKKGSKHFVFFAIAFLIGNTFMAYFIGIDKLYAVVSSPPSENLSAFIGVIGFSGVFYWIFAFFRERACTHICPYGRLQTVLLDNKSMVVAYDYKRGENRQKNVKDRAIDAGDCIDCRQCVDVCPTGIDIRNGIQLECVNCTACIDACNFVMDKINKPTDLIKFASEENIQKGSKFKFTPRLAGYSFVLAILAGLFSFILLNRSDITATITRAPGSLYLETETGDIRNIYNIKVVNKTYEEKEAGLVLPEIQGKLVINGSALIVPAENITDRMIFIDIPREKLTKNKTNIYLELWVNGKKTNDLKTAFYGPL